MELADWAYCSWFDHNTNRSWAMPRQGQANRYIKNMGKDPTFSLNGIDVIKLTDKNFLRTLENGIRFGRWVLLENVQARQAYQPDLNTQMDRNIRFNNPSPGTWYHCTSFVGPRTKRAHKSSSLAWPC